MQNYWENSKFFQYFYLILLLIFIIIIIEKLVINEREFVRIIRGGWVELYLLLGKG